MKLKRVLLGTFFATIAWSGVAQERPLWMRYPAISPDGKEIAFSYKGDIYKVSAQGGQAVRLTTNEGYEKSPVWSPDGSKIAFTSTRNNAGVNIYIMSSTGGVAKQLTTHSTAETPYTFTPDGKSVVFKAHIQDPHTSALFPTARLSELYAVSVNGGRPEQIIPTPAEAVSYSKDGSKFLYQDLKGFENDWRKHHTSSVSRDIWEYDLKSGKHRFVVQHDGEDRDPVYSSDGKKVYFLSERKGGSMNVYETDINGNGETVKALTSFKGDPIRFLSTSKDGKLCFGYAGEIYTMTPGQKPQRVNISVATDISDVQDRRLFLQGYQSASISPDGKQLAFISRGEVFVTSVDYSTTKRITNTPSGEQSVTFGADNRSIVYASDRSGKWDLYKATIVNKNEQNFPNATIIKEELLIPGNKVEKMHPAFSPDGTEVAFVLGRKKLAVYNLKSGKIREITDGSTQHGEDGDMNFEWSPDGKWFAISYVARNHAPYYDIGIVSAKGGEPIFNVTNSGYFDMNPHWAMDGNAIIFHSERYGMRNHASWGSQSDVMIAFMNREAYNKFKMNEEEFELFSEEEKNIKKEAEEKEKKEKKGKKEEDKKKAPEKKDLNIEFDNMEDRIIRLTPNSSALGDAIVTKDGKKMYYLSAFEGGYDLWSYDLRKRSTKLLRKMDSGGAQFQMDKEGKQIFILGAQPQKMTVAGETFKPISYQAEWKTDLAAEREYMFNVVKREEALRFYDAGMHGVKWDELTKHYSRYLPYISNNYDYAEMLSELLGELNVSHTGSGYRGSGASEPTAELGLFLSWEKGKDGLLVDEVITGGPFDNFRSKVKAGDIIEKIDGEDIKAGEDYFPLLNGKIRRNISVSFYSPKSKERWSETVKGISSSQLEDLLYKRWVKQRADEVDKLSKGRLGYVHIPSMGDPSFRTVYSEVMGRYYDREGIVIDIRYNGGGRLHEDLEVFFTGKKYLQQQIRGKDYCEMPSRRWNHESVMVMCEADYSNAHGTPWVYKHLGIGKLVGMPVPGTMTSVNWVTLQDPSLYFGIPAVGYKTAEGIYLENYELHPDVKVRLDFDKALKGKDTQMEAAVETLLKEVGKKE